MLGAKVFAVIAASVAWIGATAQELPNVAEVHDIVNKVNRHWQGTHPEHGRAFWDNAAYHTGNMEAYRLTGKQDYLDYSIAWAERNQWKGAKSDDKSEWKYSYGEQDDYPLFGDWQICFQTYTDLYKLDPAEHKIARAREVMEYEMSTPNSDYWWWADGLYMVMPVMTKLYNITHNQLYLDKLYEYWSYANSIMYDDEAGLYYRDGKYVYPKHTSNNGGKDFWARGDGWVIAALAKVIADLPANDVHRQEYVDRYLTMARSVAACQQPEGYWTRSMLDPEHAPGPETSGTAFFTYGLLWGMNNGLLDTAEYEPVVRRSWNYLTKTALQPDGSVGYVQPIGEKAIPGQVVDTHSTANFGVGAFLLACCEMARYVDKSQALLEIAPGYSDTSINTSIFRNNSVVSHGDWQFVSFYDPEGHLTLAKRQLGSDQWEIKHTQYTGNVADGHNVISMMVDGHGYLHVAFDHHGNKLNYCRSVAPLSLELGALESMVGKDEQDVTYPEFYRLADGKLIFVYRSGASGNGNLMMNSYDTKKRKWSRLHNVLIDGEKQRNAYWQLCVDNQGTIHLSWVWRETWLVETNHDLCYALSTDGGRTWEKSTGEKYKLPITAETAEYACRIPQKSELINQTRMAADSEGNPYIATYWRDANSAVPQYRIVWADKDGWHNTEVGKRTAPFSLSGGGTKMIPIARPHLAIDGNKIYFIMRDQQRGSRISLAYTDDLRSGRWTITDLTDFPVGAWEPGYDSELWRTKQQLHIFVQSTRQGDGEKKIAGANESVFILEYDPSAPAKSQQLFSIADPDYASSPYTGMTRSHWVAAARYLLDGAFGYIHDLDDPMYFPKQHNKTYPRDKGGIQVAKLEGMCRTFFVACHLLREDPALTLNGIKVKDYYKHQILNLITPGTDSYLPSGPNGPSQTLIELGSLCLSLKVAENVVWDEFTKAQQDSLASMLRLYGEGPTIDSNWRFFNVFILAFLRDKGYEVNNEYYAYQLNKLLERYRGEGWYNDSPAYDYYSMWAFQTYGPLWAEFFGKEQFPEQAAQFLKNQSELVDNYPYMFARDGRMNMWGRSIPYRFGSIAPLGALAYGTCQNIDYGWMRMISSSTLLQFLQSPEFMDEGVPSLGFYGPFAPSVQIYSCRGSVYWCGKAFFNLMLPEDHPYWTATESQGPWENQLQAGQVYNKFQPATNLLITNYPDCGGSEMRSWCHESVANDWQLFRSSENYNKLAYHTEFPWMADMRDGITSMNYATLNSRNEWEVLRLYDFVSFENGIYTRQAVLENDPEVSFQLNDIPLPGGVLRIDKVSAPSHRDIRLGSYSLPDLGNGITTETRALANGQEATIISNGEYSLASVPLGGWTNTRVATANGVHPVSDACSVILNEGQVDGEQVFATLHLWVKGSNSFTDAQLSPIQSIDLNSTTATITLNDGQRIRVKSEE